jgi:nicotinamide phosphoribosyltransferase
MVSDTYDYWNLVDNILPSLKEEILNHDGKLLVRPDSGDIIDISVKTVEHLWDIFGGTTNSKGYKVLDKHIGCVYGDGVTPRRAKIIYQKLMDKGFASNNIVFGAGSFSFNAFELENYDGTTSLAPCTRDTFSIAVKATVGIVNGKEIEIFKDPKTDRENGGGNFKKSQRGACRVWRDIITKEITVFLKQE